ncbi:MAG TPA: LacI family DNA-binding transcriptional regulator [Ktedonobacteraceae bacterium]|nr:LacI family DNA-binding transcriptional regulator [Ktedonobacteraceae bacterium]
MRKKPTIDDIARLAGVSRTTISRVLNHKPDVDPATRERILRIIAEQNFVPSTAASGLAGGRSRLIGMLIPAWAWWMISDLAPGIIEYIKQTPYELVLYSINDEDIERDRSEVINRLLATQLTAGLLAIYPARASQHLTRLYKQGFPVVIIDDQQEQVTPWVGVDNSGGAYTMVRHLIGLGHRRIAHILGPADYLVSHDRYNGYRQALLEEGIEPDPELVLAGDFLPQSGRACAEKLFALPPEKRPTAIFASSDQMAYGVLAAAEVYGLSVPGDIAVVGFDDDRPSAHTRPPLTTIRQPYFEMGQRGIELLLSMIEAQTGTRAEQAQASTVRISLPTRLVVRESCGATLENEFSTSSGKPFLSK